VDEAAAAEEPVLIVLGALLETEWVLRSRYPLDEASVIGAFTAVLESGNVELEIPLTVEEALYVWAQHPGADFADCLLTARGARGTQPLPDLRCRRRGPARGRAARLTERPFVYAEPLLPRTDVRALDDLLAVYEAQRSELPWDCAPLAARAYSLYRQRGGARSRPRPDFFIGAHAAIANLGALTRDRSGYVSDFPRLRRVTPEAV
jgi:predicted nucleic acid-binding protein